MENLEKVVIDDSVISDEGKPLLLFEGTEPRAASSDE
jgi:hypothetical protein